jgi:murein DD-endopeptidase MepM/ murein hydrolase activator NlpD
MRSVVCLFLSCASAGTPPAAVPAPGDAYVVSVREKGEIVNKFCAQIELADGAFRIRSEAIPDIVLIPDKPAAGDAGLAPGGYRLVLRHRRIDVPALASPDGSSMLFVSTAAIDVRLTSDACPSDVPVADGWYSPFLGGARKGFKAIENRVVGRFGDFRASRRTTRKHAGVDLRGAYGEEVYPIAAGRVIALSFRSFTSTVLIKHRTQAGETVFSKYIHLQDIPVAVGEEVKPDTRIGRLFDKAMLDKSGYRRDHLHLEIRKNYKDKGLVSSNGLTLGLLKQYCYDPLQFFRKRLRQE